MHNAQCTMQNAQCRMQNAETPTRHTDEEQMTEDDAGWQMLLQLLNPDSRLPNPVEAGPARWLACERGPK